MAYHLGHKFSTRDIDNDVWEHSCGDTYGGGWWYVSCADANVNGANLYWKHWLDFNTLRFSEMKIRPFNV